MEIKGNVKTKGSDHCWTAQSLCLAESCLQRAFAVDWDQRIISGFSAGGNRRGERMWCGAAVLEGRTLIR